MMRLIPHLSIDVFVVHPMGGDRPSNFPSQMSASFEVPVKHPLANGQVVFFSQILWCPDWMSQEVSKWVITYL